MKKEELLNSFQKIAEGFLYEINDSRTRMAIIQKFTDYIYGLQAEGILRYTLLKKFFDATNPFMRDNGTFEIKVELSDGREVTIDEYCEILTNEEKFGQVVYNTMVKLEPILEEDEEEETDLDFLIGKKLFKVEPSPNDDSSTDLTFEDGTILCISNDFYTAEK